MADVTDRFNFIHIMQEEYPAGATVRFGRGYTAAAKPNGPEELTFHLTFPKGLFFFQAAAGGPMDAGANPTLNILTLRQFYRDRLMYQPFTYPHVLLGDVVCRFGKPFLMPKVDVSTPGNVGGYGGLRAHQTEPFDLQLILVP
jgi:hypothetical protein